MAYVDQKISNRRLIVLGAVAFFHALVLYALITGLGVSIYKKAAADLKTFDVKDEPPPPPDKPPPPPPEQKQIEPPPMVTPPTIVQTPTIAAPAMQSVPTPQPIQIHVDAPRAPEPPHISQAASARGDPSAWFSTDDYPPGALRDEKEGSVGIAWDINEQGRAENCRVTKSSGTQELDDTTCRLILRRGRYTPAKDTNGSPMRSTSSRTVTWRIPKE